MDTQTATPPVDQPPMSLRAHIEAEDRAAAGEPRVEPVVDTAAPVVPDPEQAKAEADSLKADAELSEAARTLRRNRADERKAKIQREIDEAVRQREETRAELDRLRRERDEFTRAARPATAVTAGTPIPADPSDPEPTLDSFAAANPTHPDPYAGWIEARVRWTLRQEQQAERVARQRAEAEQGMTTAVRDFAQRAEAWKASHADFDAVTNDLPLTAAMQAAIFGSEHGPALAYHLATHPDDHREIAQLPHARALVALGRIEARITAAPVATAPLITKAPLPPSQTVGGGAPAGEPDTRAGVSFREHLRIENEREAQAKARGQRY